MSRGARPPRARERGGGAHRTAVVVMAALGSTSVALGGGSAAAAELRWTAPPGCPSEAEVRERLRGLVGDEVLRSDVDAHAHVRRQGERWALELSLHALGRTRTREMVSDDCATLAHATALVVATFVEPLAVGTEVAAFLVDEPVVDDPVADARTGPSPELDLTLPSIPEPPVGAVWAGPSRAAADARGPRSSERWGLRLGASAGRATQADLDLGPDLTLSWQRGVVRLAVGIIGLAPRRRRVPEHEGVTLRQWLLAGATQAGVVVPLATGLELPLSLGVEVGPLVARGEGIERPRTVTSPWLAVVGSAHIVWRPRPRWGIWLGVAAVAGVLLPRFTVAGSHPLSAGPGGLRGCLGVEWRWGWAHQIGARWPLGG